MKLIIVFNEYSGTLNKKSEAPFAEVHGGADAGPFSSHPNTEATLRQQG